MLGFSAGATQRISNQRQIPALADSISKVQIIWAGLLLALVILSSPTVLRAQGTYTESTLYSFCSQPEQNCPDGSGPQLATPVFDSQGNLYGTTAYGGADNEGNGCPNQGCGTVYKLTPNGNGTWSQTVLYSFCSAFECTDGNNPRAGLVIDSKGNLYGTTYFGGNSNNSGVVFELSPSGNGSWTEQVLYTFCQSGGCPDGKNPSAPLIFDSHGNLYGTTVGGGATNQSGVGVVFELSPNGNSWKETVVYAFLCGLSTGLCPYGSEPRAGVIFDSAGNLYGTTFVGGVVDGANVYGTVFELSPSGGSWNETVLVAFDQTNGENPVAPVTIDSQGNVYGTTTAGGANQEYGGTVFELSPSQGGWTEQILWNFSFSGILGYSPEAGLVLDAHGNLYGNSAAGAGHLGAAFELSPAGNGQWTPTLVYEFCQVPVKGGCGDGEAPASAMIFDAHDNLYGTAGGGIYGSDSGGVVYELSPVPLISTTTVLKTSPNPSNVAQQVTMTATVTAQNGSLPTGTVIFESNGVQIGSAELNGSGVAVFNYSALNAGTDNIVAMYQGSSTLAPSTSNTVQQVVDPVNSTTMVTSAPNPSTFGQAVTITATVSPSGPPAPTGTVGFASNGVGLSGCSAVPLSSSLTAMCMTSSLAVGTDTLQANYSGDSNYHHSSGTETQIVNPTPSAIQFVPITPCRIVDTRGANGTFGGPPITGNTSRSFPLSQSGNPCGIPSTALAYSLNVTVVPVTTLGYLTIWPTGEGQPVVSTLNSPDGRVKANAAIVPAGTPSGSVSVYVSDTTNVILDIDGYFAAPTSGSLQFYPLTPCRIVDTRNGQDQGSLQPGVERDYTIAGNCGVPSSAAAYSFNVTVIPAAGGLDYLTVWPKGQTRPTVSTLNDNTGTIVANAAIVPAGGQHATAFYAHSNKTDLLLDIDGYFAAPGSGGLSFYPLTPCRVLDTRQNGGKGFIDTITIPVESSVCGPPASAEGYVLNATVVPPAPMLYLTLWPHGETQPTVSTLNAEDGFITSNMAIVPTNDGEIDAYAYALTQLILDISGYFAP